MPAPTPRAAVLVGLAALIGVWLPLWVGGLALAAIVLATLADAVLVRRPGAVRQDLPAVVPRAAPVPFGLVALEPPPGTIRLRQPTPPDVEVEPSEADGALTSHLIARRRGRHVLPAPAARCTGALGLGRWYREVGAERDIAVFPDLPAARRLAALARAGALPESTRRRGPIGLGTDFDLIRDYSPDDDVRQINWRATARLGRPMSNQYRIEQDRDVLLLVDAGRLTAAPVGGATVLDLVIDAACAVAATADAVGDRAGVLAFDAVVLRQVAPRRRGAAAVAQALHDVESAAVESDYRLAFEVAARRKRALVLVFTDVFEETAARPLLEALPGLARRHAVVVATIADPAIAMAMAAAPASRYDVMRASVATELADRRRRLVAVLAGAGAEVLDARPDDLSAACVRAYLRLKARSRL